MVVPSKKAYKKPEVKSVKIARAKPVRANGAKEERVARAKPVRANGAKEERVALVVHVPKSTKATLLGAARGQDLTLSAFCRGVLAGRIDAP